MCLNKNTTHVYAMKSLFNVECCSGNSALSMSINGILFSASFTQTPGLVCLPLTYHCLCCGSCCKSWLMRNPCSSKLLTLANSAPYAYKNYNK